MEFYTIKDICEILPIGRTKVYQLVHVKGFPKITIGKKIVIPKDKFEAWVNDNMGNDICI